MRGRFVSMATCAILCASPSINALGQDAAQAVYAKVADSVLLIEVQNEQQQTVGQATAFVVGQNTLLTNNHAVSGGTVWLKLGPVSIPCTVERVDPIRDLALLKVSGNVTVPVLPLASEEPKAGTRVFVVGNPKGFEKTISEGLVTGARVVEGQRLLQMSAPISPGSSGGPVVNDTGEVVGVSVAMLRDAQNLNFAVPLTETKRFIRGDRVAESDGDIRTAIEQLLKTRSSLTYSADTDSEWARLTAQLKSVVTTRVPTISSEADLAWICQELSSVFEHELTTAVAERWTKVAPRSADAYDHLASAMWFIANTEEQYAQAEPYAIKAVELGGKPVSRARLLLLGRIQSQVAARQAAAVTHLTQAVGNERDQTAQQASLALAEIFRRRKSVADARRWFEAAEGMGKVFAYWYDDYAQMLEEAGEHRAAASAYARSGSYRNLCNAAREFANAEDIDQTLHNARACLDKAANATKKDDDTVEWAHRLIANALLNRGVLEEAISHAKQAIAVSADNGVAFAILARALNRAERWAEAEAAARAAIRLRDGDEGDHFQLGFALFRQQRWSEAARSFEQVARMEPTDAASTYNLGLCYSKLAFYADAARWYEETLRRDPKHPEADDIRRRIQALRAR